MKDITKKFTEKVLQENKGKNVLFKTNLLSIQMSKSDPKSKKKADAEALKNKLSNRLFQLRKVLKRKRSPSQRRVNYLF